MGFGGNVAIALRRERLQATDVCFPRRLTSLADLPLRQKSGPTVKTFNIANRTTCGWPFCTGYGLRRLSNFQTVESEKRWLKIVSDPAAIRFQSGPNCS